MNYIASLTLFNFFVQFIHVDATIFSPWRTKSRIQIEVFLKQKFRQARTLKVLEGLGMGVGWATLLISGTV